MDTLMPPAEELYAENLALKKELGGLKEELSVLRSQIAWLKKQLFGPGKSEKRDRSQLLLKLAELETLLTARTEASQTISYERSKPGKPRPAAADTFKDLPVHETVEIVPEEVKADPELYERIGEERTFEVDITPPKLFKREIVRPKFRHCLERSRAPVLAPAPKRPVEGGYASAGLLAWVTLGKYVDHLPLYRQEKMSARWGAPISRQSMNEWVRIAAQWLQPIYRCMHRRLLESAYVQVDETPVRCRDPDENRGKTFEGRLWVASRPGSDVLFWWARSRGYRELTAVLGEEYRGVLQSDGYQVYGKYAAEHSGVVQAGCWAHARRGFFEAQAESPKAARVALTLIGRLYRMERDWDQADQATGRPRDPLQRAGLRERFFERTLRWLRAFAISQRERVLPKSALGKACDYLLSQWDSLIVHVRHGDTRLDNNLVENAIRPSAIGKKNWLFIGHPDAGERSAIIYSIVVSCQRHGIDPFVYLRDVLTRLPLMTNQDDLEALTPVNWKPATP